MQAGTLNRRIKIKEYSEVEDEWGMPVGGWVIVATVWGNVKHLSGLETVRNNVEVSEVKASIRIRARAGITPAMVAEVDNRNYQIDAVLPHNPEYMDLICKVTA